MGRPNWNVEAVPTTNLAGSVGTLGTHGHPNHPAMPCSMTEDMEQSQTVEASPNMARTQTPLLSRFLAAASPAISIKNFGRGGRATPHLRRARGDSTAHSEDPEAVGRIEEEETEDEESQRGSPRSPKASNGQKLPLIQVEAPSKESIDAEQPGAGEP